jgi:hypothetical protein
MAKRSRRREWTRDDFRELKALSSSTDPSSENREVAQADARRNAAEGVFAWCIIGFARLRALAGRAQQGERMRRIGVLMASAADDSESQARMAAFLQGLAAIGLDRGPQRADRHALACGRCGPSHIRG